MAIPNIWAGIAAVATIASLAGALVQNQINVVKEELRDARSLALSKGDAIADDFRRNDVEIKKELRNLRDEITARRTEVIAEVKDVRAESYNRRLEYVSKDEFRQFQESMNDRWRTQAEINKQAVDAYLSVKAWETWRAERDKLITEVNTRLREIERMHQQLPK